MIGVIVLLANLFIDRDLAPFNISMVVLAVLHIGLGFAGVSIRRENTLQKFAKKNDMDGRIDLVTTSNDETLLVGRMDKRKSLLFR